MNVPVDSPEFKVQLDRYARLLVEYGVNVQPGQVLNLLTETVHRDLALAITEAAYKRGAKYVDVGLGDNRMDRARLRHSDPDHLDFVPDYQADRYRALVDDAGATLRLLGSEDPDCLSDEDPKRINRLRMANYRARKYFHDEGIGKSRVHWTVAAAATPAWGQKVFPDLAPDAACEALWNEIFKICRVDSDDFLERWQGHNETLQERGRKLSAIGIETLRFHGGGTDLQVGLSPAAIFCGGSDTGPRGADFEPNVPTEEVFTTPDYRRTQGHVKTTRPFLVNGKLVEGLSLDFKDGVVKNFEATSGATTFGEYIESDAGGKRLGEVALVGIDSPIYQSGLVFQEILFDENAACHIAVGSAYKTCLKNGENLTDEALAEIGCNDSSVHTDMMISSEEVNVTATTRDGDQVELLQAGRWVDGF